MSFIPNTTPTPNWLYNGEMKKMSDTELRVVLIITRHTFGWIENTETGMRKQEDWISHSLLIKETGRGSRAISNAVDNCVKHGWIETRDKNGKLLNTSDERRRRKVYYRLGNIFTSKLKSTAERKVDENLPHFNTKSTALNDTNLPQKGRNTKETITKETIQKGNASVAGEIAEIIDLFKEINPSYGKFFKNTTQRGAVERLLKKHGREKIEQVISVLPITNTHKYAPTITTPLQLEDKLAQLINYSKKQKSDNKKSRIIE
jgi:hypothetical protein